MLDAHTTRLPEFSTIYDNVRSILRKRARGLHSSDLDDISQIVMEKILRAGARGKGPSRNAKAWVKRIAHNEHVNWVRQRGRARLCPTADVESAGPTDAVNSGASILFLRAVQGQLTRRQCEVARMFSSGYTGKEIARELGLSPALISLEKKLIRDTLTDMGYQRHARAS